MFKPYRVSDHTPSVLCIHTLAVLTEERFLKQKAKIQWLKEGDANSSYFHKAVKSRVSRSRIDTVTNSEGVVLDNNTVHVAFVKHYEMFLGQEAAFSRKLGILLLMMFILRLKTIISPNQSAFIPGRSITDNILLTQELMHNYHLERGKLPIKYLGVPLVSSRLMIRDCNELVDKVQIRIQDWKNKSLSIAGQLQLIHSILGSMHINWASVFFLPNHVLLNIEQLMREFLWSHRSSGKGKSK
nr:hypothetical protein [Tanacetum cinerariifolium]